MSDLAPLLQGFFTDKLIHQRQASPHTIAAYRDAMAWPGFRHFVKLRRPFMRPGFERFVDQHLGSDDAY